MITGYWETCSVYSVKELELVGKDSVIEFKKIVSVVYTTIGEDGCKL